MQVAKDLNFTHHSKVLNLGLLYYLKESYGHYIQLTLSNANFSICAPKASMQLHMLNKELGTCQLTLNDLISIFSKRKLKTLNNASNYI